MCQDQNIGLGNEQRVLGARTAEDGAKNQVGLFLTQCLLATSSFSVQLLDERLINLAL